MDDGHGYDCPQSGYKVLIEFQDGTLHSVGYNIGIDIEYSPDRWVEPRLGDGPLSVFRNTNDAMDFICGTFQNTYDIRNVRLWKCNYFESEHGTQWYHHRGHRIGRQAHGPIVLARSVILMRDYGLVVAKEYHDIRRCSNLTHKWKNGRAIPIIQET